MEREREARRCATAEIRWMDRTLSDITAIRRSLPTIPVFSVLTVAGRQ